MKTQKLRKFSFEMGGMIGESCGPGDGGNGRSSGKGCSKKTKFGRRSIPPWIKKTVTGVVAGGATLIANKKYGLVDKAKEAMGFKYGGTVNTRKAVVKSKRK